MGSRLAIGLHDDDATDADGNGLKTQRKLAGDRRYVDKPPPSSAPPPSNYLMKSPVCSQHEHSSPHRHQPLSPCSSLPSTIEDAASRPDDAANAAATAATDTATPLLRRRRLPTIAPGARLATATPSRPHCDDTILPPLSPITAAAAAAAAARRRRSRRGHPQRLSHHICAETRRLPMAEPATHHPRRARWAASTDGRLC